VSTARDDPHTLAGAYAMDAVGASDQARFERHLAGCEACREEVRGLREAVAALAAAAAMAPRPALRDAVLETAARTRQLPPLTGHPPEPRGRPGRAGAAAAGRPAWWSGPEWLRDRPVARRLVLGLASGIVAAAVALGAVSYTGMRDRLNQAQGRDHTVAAVLSAPDADMLSGRVRTGGTVTVVMSHRMRMLVITAADLRVLPSSQRYEVWLMGPAGSRPAGMIEGSGPAPMSRPMVVSGLSAGDNVGMTVEPASGSPQPTSRPVLLIALTG
jgi:anti-sigma-K factor RskA